MKKKFIIHIYFILLTAFMLSCEEAENLDPDDSGLFIRFLGGAKTEEAFDVIATPDGGYLCLGNSDSGLDSSQNQVFLIKLSEEGEKEWEQKILGTIGRSLKATPDGGFIIVGAVTDSTTGNVDLSLIKTNNTGQLVWTQTYGDSTKIETGFSVNNTTDGGFLVLGNLVEPAVSQQVSGWVIRTNAEGDVANSFPREIALEDVSVNTSNVIENNNGNFVWSATASPTIGSETDMLAVITNINGGIISRAFYGGNNTETSGEIQEIPGGYIFVGATQSFGSGNSDVYLVRLADDGSQIWAQTYGSPENDLGNSVTQTQDGGFIVTGSTTTTEQTTDIFVIKTDSQGNEQWTKTFGGDGDDSGVKVLETNDSGFLIFGTVNFGNNDMLGIIRTNSQGELIN